MPPAHHADHMPGRVASEFYECMTDIIPLERVETHCEEIHPLEQTHS